MMGLIERCWIADGFSNPKKQIPNKRFLGTNTHVLRLRREKKALDPGFATLLTPFPDVLRTAIHLTHTQTGSLLTISVNATKQLFSKSHLIESRDHFDIF